MKHETIENKLNLLTEMVAELNQRLGNLTPDSKPLAVEEAANYLGIAKPTLYTLTSKRLIPHKKTRQKVILLKADLDNWLEPHHQKTVKEIGEG